ncbi:hypothetical protein GQ651_15175 [Alphaproteobacteria bacterium GH1-50]|uniref:Lipase (Class 3) n=1 Tax=Kangsaoukella pontilimi TaxID=2691042 RepID=A0A7C9IIC9_9RHOB|nr:hypothetical protein [Kangsaoukella pontilimi]MXQ09187.1 hypothetical protein [Kangsaoukella pontilimi]
MEDDLFTPVYLLDLCILAYQLHSQALVRPFDPYCEQIRVLASSTSREEAYRTGMLSGMRDHYRAENMQSGVSRYRGPADFLVGSTRQHNPALETIVQDYRRVSPWRPGVSRQNGDKEGFVLYVTPPEITRRIAEFWIVSEGEFDPTAPGEVVNKNNLTALCRERRGGQGATDLLVAFEGQMGLLGANDTGMSGLLGHVLARKRDDANLYDLFVVFRGSRSGKYRSGVMNTNEGHPDYVTNFGMNEEKTAKAKMNRQIQVFPDIAKEPVRNHLGYARCVDNALPAIDFAVEIICRTLDEQGAGIGTFHAVGHSLGGALAGVFTEALQFQRTAASQSIRKSINYYAARGGVGGAVRPSPFAHDNPLFSTSLFIDRKNSAWAERSDFLKLQHYRMIRDKIDQETTTLIARYAFDEAGLMATPLVDGRPLDFEKVEGHVKDAEFGHSPQALRPALRKKQLDAARTLQDADRDPVFPDGYDDEDLTPWLEFSRTIRKEKKIKAPAEAIDFVDDLNELLDAIDDAYNPLGSADLPSAWELLPDIPLLDLDFFILSGQKARGIETPEEGLSDRLIQFCGAYLEKKASGADRIDPAWVRDVYGKVIGKTLLSAFGLEDLESGKNKKKRRRFFHFLIGWAFAIAMRRKVLRNVKDKSRSDDGDSTDTESSDADEKDPKGKRKMRRRRKRPTDVPSLMPDSYYDSDTDSEDSSDTSSLVSETEEPDSRQT